jgi:GPH family glycoside/pentoside/hexuronide:cation symporter
MVKFGFAIAGGLSGVIMSSVGFDSGETLQPEGAIDGLRLAFSGIPILGTLIAMYVMRDYDVTEERAGEIRAALDKRASDKNKKLTSVYQTDKLNQLSITDLVIDNSTDIDFNLKTDVEIKELFNDTLNKGLHGLCFSPYLEGQNIGDELSQKQIRQRIEIIAPYTKWTRSFSCTQGNEFIPKIAREKGLKTLVGAWIGSDKVKNDIEIDGLIELAKKGFVDIAVVGNEVLLRNELSEKEIISYIRKVKEALPNIPVGYVDAYYQFIEHPNLVEVCDLVLANCYPFWEGCSIEKSSIYLKQMYAGVKKVAKDKPVIITETGWPNKGQHTKAAEPSKINAMKYFINSSKWAGQKEIPMFYFSSFDESWKIHHEGDVGASWGIWDKNENLKYN